MIALKFILSLLLALQLQAHEPSVGLSQRLPAEMNATGTAFGCVNVTSGDFFHSSSDLFLTEAPDLNLIRYYDSGHTSRSFMALGTRLDIPLLLTESSSIHGALDVDERQGVSLTYSNPAVHKPSILFVDEKTMQRTRCNEPMTSPSGGARDPRNRKLLRDGKQRWLLLLGDGTKRIYSRKEKEKYYLLERQILPNGRTLHYAYDTNHGIAVRLSDWNDRVTFGSVFIQSSKKKSSFFASNGQNATLYAGQKAFTAKTAFLTSRKSYEDHLDGIDGDHLTRTFFKSDNKRKDLLVPGKITKMEYPEGRSLLIDYDWSTGRVKSLHSSSDKATGRELIAIFSYGKEKKGLRFTTVRDGDNHATIYRYTEENRITTVERYETRGGRDHLLLTSRFFWSEENGRWGDLLAKGLIDESGSYRLLLRYHYDDHGNLIQETSYGDISGSGPDHFSLNERLLIPQESVDSFSRYFRYSSEGMNLLLEESDDRGFSTLYTYLPTTNLPLSIIQKRDGVIFSRTFHRYDELYLLRETIVDDSTSEDPNDHEGMTKRLITRFTPRLESPLIGLVEWEDHFYLDEGVEIPLTRKHFLYDQQGKIIAEELFDSAGNLISEEKKSYDRQGNLLQTIDPTGVHRTFTYDGNGNRLSEEVHSGGLTRLFTYDIRNRKTCSTVIRENESPEITHHFYNTRNLLIEEKGPLGHVTTFEYDGLQRLTKTSSKQRTIAQTYDCFGNVIAKSDDVGMIKREKFNCFGKPIEVEYPDGSTESFRYHLDGRLKEHVDVSKRRTLYLYDRFLRLIEEVKEASDQSFSYKKQFFYTNDQLKLLKTPLSATEYVYDKAGRLIMQRSGSLTKTIGYDDCGREISTVERCEISQRSQSKRSFYDALNRVIEKMMIDDDEKKYHHTLYRYDENGNIIEEVILGGEKAVTSKKRWHVDRCIEEIDPLGHATTHHYSTESILEEELSLHRVSFCDGSEEYHYQNEQKQLILSRFVSPSGETIKESHHRYNSRKEKIETIDRAFEAGQEISLRRHMWEYDNRGRCILWREEDGHSLTRCYSYNPDGSLANEREGDGPLLSYIYDGFGHLIALTSSDETISYRFDYDDEGHLTHSYDSLHDLHTAREYDQNGFLKKERLANGLSLLYERDSFGRILKLHHPDDSIVHYNYSGLYLTSAEKIHPLNPLLSYSYAIERRDHQGRILEENLPFHLGKIQREYDPIGNNTLLQSPFHQERVEGGAFDPFSNPKEIQRNTPSGNYFSRYSYDSLSQLTQESGQVELTYDFNPLGKSPKTIVRKEILYDGYGRISSFLENEKRLSLHYDPLGRLTLVEVRDKEGELQEADSYEYDSFHRRIRSHHRSNEATLSTNYLYLSNHEIGSWDESDQPRELRMIVEGYGSESGAGPLFELDQSPYLPLYSREGHVVALIDPFKEEAQECYRYSAFGDEWILSWDGKVWQERTTSPLRNPWRYASKRHDDATGLIFFGRRYYAPTLRQWLSPDPAGLSSGNNLYAFVDNNPLTNSDLFGLFPQSLQQSSPFLHWGNVWRPVCHFMHSVITFPGQAMEFIGRHFIPIRPLRNALIMGGRLLAGKWRNDSSWPEYPSHNGDLQRPEKYSNHRVIFVNGILNTLSDARESAAQISNCYDGANVHYTYNSTQGFFNDILETGKNYFGFPTAPAQHLLQNIYKCLRQVPYGRVSIVAHSQGGVILRSVMPRIHPQDRHRLYLKIVGAPCRFHKGWGFGDLDPLTNHKDFIGGIAFIDPSAPASPSVVTSKKRNSFFEHSITDPTYMEQIRLFKSKHVID